MTSDGFGKSSGFEAPQDALQGYFDDLLGGFFDEEPSTDKPVVAVAPPVPVQTISVRAPSVAPAPAAIVASAARPFAEPDPEPQMTEHRARLQKLLQSARLHPPVAETRAETKVVAPVIDTATVSVEPVPAESASEALVTPDLRSKVLVRPSPEALAAAERQRQKLREIARVAEAERLADEAMIALAEAAATAPAVSAPTARQRLQPDPLPVPVPVSQPEVVPVAETEVPTTAATEDPVSATAEDPSDDPLLAWLANGRPRWAQERFDVLLFEVGGLTLAVPLIALGQIQPLTDELTPLFGQASWFMGLQPTPVGKVRTVNTALFVMPERYDEKFLTTARYVVSIADLPWGLAVDKVNQPITLAPEDVKWRTERSKRPWLAGTVKEHRCALIDIPMMGRLLQDADANSNKGRHKPVGVG